jgi:hypothetical protein
MHGRQRRPGAWIAGASVPAVPSREEAWSQTGIVGMALVAGGVRPDLGAGRRYAARYVPDRIASAYAAAYHAMAWARATGGRAAAIASRAGARVRVV